MNFFFPLGLPRSQSHGRVSSSSIAMREGQAGSGWSSGPDLGGVARVVCSKGAFRYLVAPFCTVFYWAHLTLTSACPVFASTTGMPASAECGGQPLRPLCVGSLSAAPKEGETGVFSGGTSKFS